MSNQDKSLPVQNVFLENIKDTKKKKIKMLRKY